MKLTFPAVIGAGLMAIGLAFMTGGAVHAWRSPGIYQSTARVDVQNYHPEVSSFFPCPHGFAPRDAFWVATQTETIKSKSVLYRVIENLQLHRKWSSPLRHELLVDDAYTLLRQQLQVKQAPASSEFQIQVRSHDRIEAADLANEIGSVFAEEKLQSQRKQLDGYLARMETTVRESEALVERLRNEFDNSEADRDRTDAGQWQTRYDDAMAAAEQHRRVRAELMLWVAEEKERIETDHPLVHIVEGAEPGQHRIVPWPPVLAASVALGLLLFVSGTLLLARE